MQISFIVAASENNVIGVGAELPWHLPLDLKFFKKTTIGKPVVMGRKTFESLGRALPNRLNVVLSKHWKEAPEPTIVFTEINEALSFLKKENYEEVFIIGGGEIFKSSMDLVNVIYITRVHTIVTNGTAFFPEIDSKEWKLEWEEHHEEDEKHQYSFTFQKWVK